jgi:hypothetical protein
LRIWRDPGTYIGIVAPRHPQGRRPQNGLILCRRRVNPPAADNPARRIAMTPTRQMARVHLLPGRDHQLNNDLSEVAEAIRISRPRPAPHT